MVEHIWNNKEELFKYIIVQSRVMDSVAKWETAGYNHILAHQLELFQACPSMILATGKKRRSTKTEPLGKVALFCNSFFAYIKQLPIFKLKYIKIQLL